MSRARDMANLGTQAGSGFDASDLTTGTLGNTVQDNITRLGTVTTGTLSHGTTLQGYVDSSNTGVTFPAGTIVQVVKVIQAQDEYHSSTSFSPNKSNITLQITPKFASSNIIIHVSGTGYATSSSAYAYYDLYKNASDITETYGMSGVSAGLSQLGTNGNWGPMNFTFEDTCSENSTSQKTYAVTWRAHAVNGNVYFGWGSNAKASIFAYEVTT